MKEQRYLVVGCCSRHTLQDSGMKISFLTDASSTTFILVTAILTSGRILAGSRGGVEDFPVISVFPGRGTIYMRYEQYRKRKCM
jgi:hypothetical protein